MAGVVEELQTLVSSQQTELEVLRDRISDAPLCYTSTGRSLKEGFLF